MGRLSAVALLAAGVLAALPTSANAAVTVLKTRYTIAQFEAMTGVKLTNTVGGKTFFSFWKPTSKLSANGFNFFINRKTGMVVVRTLSNVKPLTFTSVFTDSKTKKTTNISWNVTTPSSVTLSGLPKGPITISPN